jgi:hypothetical protein
MLIAALFEVGWPHGFKGVQAVADDAVQVAVHWFGGAIDGNERPVLGLVIPLGGYIIRVYPEPMETIGYGKTDEAR